jgi:hypothetical protein
MSKSQPIVTKTDIELALHLVREWSRDNQNSTIEWRYLIASSNICALAQWEAADRLSEIKKRKSEAKQQLDNAEELAYLRALAALMSEKGKMLPDGSEVRKLSYAQASATAKQFVGADDAVTQAKANLLLAEAAVTKLDQQVDALKEISQGAKSTAQNLNKEPV